MKMGTLAVFLINTEFSLISVYHFVTSINVKIWCLHLKNLSLLISVSFFILPFIIECTFVQLQYLLMIESLKLKRRCFTLYG